MLRSLVDDNATLQKIFLELPREKWKKIMESDSIPNQVKRIELHTKELDELLPLLKCPSCLKIGTLRKSGQPGLSYKLRCSMKECTKLVTYIKAKKELCDLAQSYWEGKIQKEDLFQETEKKKQLSGKRKSPRINTENEETISLETKKKKMIATEEDEDEEEEEDIYEDEVSTIGDRRLRTENRELRTENKELKAEIKEIMRRMENLEKLLNELIEGKKMEIVKEKKTQTYADIASGWKTVEGQNKNKKAIQYKTIAGKPELKTENRFTELKAEEVKELVEKEREEKQFTDEQVQRVIEGKAPNEPPKVEPVIVKGIQAGPIRWIRKVMRERLDFSMYKIKNICFIGRSICEFLIDKRSCEEFRKKLGKKFPGIVFLTDDPMNTVLSIEKDKPEEEKKKIIAGQYLRRLERVEQGPICNTVARWIGKEKRRAIRVTEGIEEIKKPKELTMGDFMIKEEE